MGELLLGVDIGTSSSKAVLTTPDGVLVDSSEIPHGVSTPAPGQVEQDAEMVWWEEFRGLCDRLLTTDSRDRLAGVCVSGIGPSLLLCDGRLNPLRPAILYGVDRRAGAQIDELNDRYGADEILNRCGSGLSSQALGPKLLWVRQEEPDIWTKATGWYMPSSFVISRLTGEYVLDHHSASQCDPMYDLTAGTWAEDWAQELSGRVPLPRLVWPGEIAGRVTPAGSEASGLPVGLPVMGGTIDAVAEACSVGVTDPGDLMIMYGSTMFILGLHSTGFRDLRFWSTKGAEDGIDCIAAGMATSGSLVEWIRALTGDPPITDLVAGAAGVAPGSNGVLTLPYFAGERSPIFDPAARGVVLGLTLEHDQRHLARSVFEAIAFGIHHNLEAIRESGAEFERITAVGGGARSDLLPQIVSDVTGLEQAIPAETVGASYGDALLAAIGAGLVPADTDWTEIDRTLVPEAANRTTYDRMYELYRAAYPATAEICHALAAQDSIGPEGY